MTGTVKRAPLSLDIMCMRPREAESEIRGWGDTGLCPFRYVGVALRAEVPHFSSMFEGASLGRLCVNPESRVSAVLSVFPTR